MASTTAGVKRNWPLASIYLWPLAYMVCAMSEEFPSRLLEKVVVRLPDGMRDTLKIMAEANKRSMNAEIVARLEESFLPPRQREAMVYVTDRPEIPPGDYDLGDAVARLEKVMEQLKSRMRDPGE